MNVLFVPSLGVPDSLLLLERLAQSIDYPVQYKVAFNNGIAGALDEFRDKHQDWIVKESHIGNMGVAGSWNYCAKWWSSQPAWLLMNEDAWFLPGYLEKICQCVDANLTAPIIHLNDSHAYYCFAWTLAGRDAFGEFDENFWPAYMEDCDMRVRHRLMGVTTYPYALQGMPPLPHGKPKSGGVDYSAMIQGCGLLNRAYWRRKWGAMNFEEAIFRHPYNDHRLTEKEWVWYPEHRSELHPLWRTFIEAPEPSIYK